MEAKGAVTNARRGAPAGDPQKTVKAEFDAAARAGTIEAWDMFIARHASNILAPEARRRRARLLTRRP